MIIIIVTVERNKSNYLLKQQTKCAKASSFLSHVHNLLDPESSISPLTFHIAVYVYASTILYQETSTQSRHYISAIVSREGDAPGILAGPKSVPLVRRQKAVQSLSRCGFRNLRIWTAVLFTFIIILLYYNLLYYDRHRSVGVLVFIHLLLLSMFQCCRRHVVGQQIVSDISV